MKRKYSLDYNSYNSKSSKINTNSIEKRIKKKYPFIKEIKNFDELNMNDN